MLVAKAFDMRSLDLAQYLTLCDQLAEAFRYVSGWVKGQYLAEEIIQRKDDPEAVEVATELLQGRWPQGLNNACHWPARDAEVYLKLWQPNMAFGIAEEIHQARMDEVEFYAVATGPRDDSRISELHKQLAEATPERIQQLLDDWLVA